MRSGLLWARERWVWLLCFVVVAATLVLTHFSSTDGDSGLYAAMSAKLAQTPISRWLAPEWWGLWPDMRMTGLFLEHPAGVFLLPAALQRLGIPAEQGAYVVGVGAGLVSLLLIGSLTARIASRDEGRAVLVLLQLMPVAFIFRIRANHEYPMLVCLLVTIIGLETVRRSWSGFVLVALGLTAGLVIKGFFVSLILLAAGLWLLINPTGSRERPARPWIACAVGIAVTAGVAIAYDAIYRHATGVTFWGPYWTRQLGPVTFASPLEDLRTLASHFGFYVLRLAWHPAPWSLALVWATWRRSGLATTRAERRALAFVLVFTALAVMLLSLPSRFAERYAFSATYLVATSGAVAAYRLWPGLRSTLGWLEETIPALPAVTWFTLIALRLALGPWLPHIG